MTTKKKIKSTTQDRVLGVVRHILTAGGGYLTAKGYVDADGVEQLVGAVITIAGTVWSILSKKDD